ncbi:MAG: DNA polymerase III subunit delta [Brumimicrobium sp.]|nr:DNA polymerase III subunit delta [Brumimicrobium sp.]
MEINEIIKEFKSRQTKPIYFFHGEEPFYIDQGIEAAMEYTLEDHEKDFNQSVMYGKDVDLNALLEELKQFPMMAEKRLVVLKEAQEVKDWSALENYFDNPSPTTLFVIGHKYKKADARKKYFKSIQKNGFIFESKKVYENQLDTWIKNYLKSKGYTITLKAAILLIDFLGNDLSKIARELDKLSIILEKGTEISEVHIEENIGISKDYNPFELSSAIAKRDVLKAQKIINYFEQNPKATHITVVIPTIFSLFERLMKAHFLGTGDIKQLQMSLGINYFVAQEIMKAKTIYKPKKIAMNISLLHEYDLKSKGVNRGAASDSDLMREMIYQLMH